ncbi:MAG: hypothetical protein U9Q69_04185 [Nanoarchaeota archaeon]|nr:hypothetical protein [Nanoarchaeota archaeon]
MQKQEILKIANATYKSFPNKIQKPLFKIFNKKEFQEYLNGSPLKPNADLSPSFVSHLPSGELIGFCQATINKMIKGKSKEFQILFLESITLHELYHIKNRNKNISIIEAINSENQVNKEFAKNHPKLAEMLKDFMIVGRKLL